MSRASVLAVLALLAFASIAPAAGPANRVYELRVYTANPGKLDALNARFRDHTCRIFQKHGMEIVGFWTPLDDKDGKADKLYYLLAFPSREAAKKSWEEFRADDEWKKVKAESEKDGVLAGKVESTFLDATDYSPTVPIGKSKPTGSADARTFELRTYTASPDKLDDLNKRFREHTMEIFSKHGMTNVGYWVPQDEAQGHADTLVYLLAFPSRESAKKSWKDFGDDPAWQKVYKESQADGIPLAKVVKSVYLTPTDYSPRNHAALRSRPLSIVLDDVRLASERLGPWVHRTPVLTSHAIDDAAGASLFFKCENFQRVGAFKFRGAMNAVLQLDEESRRKGVVTHSSGNHAQALALAGKLVGVPVCVVMPRTAPAIKRAATEGYGARVVPCEPTLADREATVARLIAEHGYVLVHPFDNWQVIAGQGTASWELLDQAGPFDAVVVPCGGGGLLAGTAVCVKGRSPSTAVLGAEPLAADDARRSLELGAIQPSNDPRTIADGLRTSLGERTFAVIREKVDGIGYASDAETLAAMRLVWERLKILIEPSCAVPVAAVLSGRMNLKGKRVGIVLSGGNVDLDPFFEAMAAKWL